jgi:hypothetical protein
LAGIIQIEQLKEGEDPTKKRKAVMRSHGFRKFVNTTMVDCRIDSSIRNKLLGHSIGLDKSYWKPQVTDLLTEYLKVVDALTINDEDRLKRQVETLKTNKSEIQQIKEELEQIRAVTKAHINEQVKESLKLEGVRISETLAEMLYPSEKARLYKAISKYKMEHNLTED